MSYVTLEIEERFEAAHRLLKYNGPCCNIHGHTYRVKVGLASVTAPANGPGLLPNGMVIDFKDAKPIIRNVLGMLDHALILSSEDPLVSLLGDNSVELLGFKLDIVMLPNQRNPTAENLAITIKERLEDSFHKIGIRVVEVKVWETPTSSAAVR